MYTEQASIPIKSSASLLYNNFDVLSSNGEIETLFSVVHKSNVWVFNPEEVQHDHNAYKRVVCKGEISQNSSMIMQARWCQLSQRTLLVVASVKGVQMFDSAGTLLVFWMSLQQNKGDSKGQFGRGITAVGDQFICVGTADGNILVFDIPSSGNTVKLKETLQTNACSINDLHGCGDRMVSCDDSGRIILWNVGSRFTKDKIIDGYGSPCTSVRLCAQGIVAGYGSGHVRLFHTESGALKIKVAAHAKWINAIDVSEDGELLLSSSEDTYVRVWKIKKFELAFQKSVTDVQLTGCRFLDKHGDSFGATGYDSTEVFIFKKP